MTDRRTEPADIGRYVRRLANLNRVAIATFGLLLMATIVFAGWSANNSAIQRDRQQLTNAMAKKLSLVQTEQKSIAWWDDAVVNITGAKFNRDWTHENFGTYLSQSFGHDEVYILDGDNQPVYAARRTRMMRNESFAVRAAVFVPLIAKVRSQIGKPRRTANDPYNLEEDNYPDLRDAMVARAATALVTMNNAPVVVSVMTIVPNRNIALLKTKPFLLLSLVRINNQKMAELSSSLMMKGLSLSRYPTSIGSRVSHPMLDDKGKAVAYFNWFPRKPGDPLLVFILPFVAVGVICVGVMARLMEAKIKTTAQSLAASEAAAMHAANHDMLSQLPNRLQFNAMLKDMLAEFDPRGASKILIAYLDIDRFKDVNDTLGHEAGDTLIQIIAERLLRALGPSDMIARFGGDEFAILMRIDSRREVERVGNLLLASFEQPCMLNNQAIQIGTSIGFALAPDHGTTQQDLFRSADIALYQAKENGRGQWAIFNDQMAARVQQRREIEQDLRAALNNTGTDDTSCGVLSLAFQPVIAARDFRMIGVEALLRWSHPTRGNISPGEFIPVAEEAGLMPALGNWILEEAFGFAENWPNLEVAINLSPVQFRHADLIGILRRLLARTKVKPQNIVFEITEGLLLDDSVRVRSTFDTLRHMGFKTALDDFGTGYSSLKYLCEFKFDKIKIDQSFVRAATPDGQAMAIIHAVITVGQGFGMTITAEGVETAVQEKLLRIIGCTELQGFRYSPAVSAAQIDAFLALGGNHSMLPKAETTRSDPALISLR